MTVIHLPAIRYLQSLPSHELHELAATARERRDIFPRGGYDWAQYESHARLLERLGNRALERELRESIRRMTK